MRVLALAISYKCIKRCGNICEGDEELWKIFET